MSSESTLRFAVPGRGRLEEPTASFLAHCELSVVRPNPRQYVASLQGFPTVEVHLQRPRDILAHVAGGNADLGVTGFDILTEFAAGDARVLLVHDDLGFGAARLVIAVPDDWLDVTTIGDLSEVAIQFKRRDHAEPLRVASESPNLTRDYLYANGVANFELVEFRGAVEGAPAAGYADVAAALVHSGTTLLENRLRALEGPPMLESAACLVANRDSLRRRPDKLATVRQILERMEAGIAARGMYQLTANLAGRSADAVARRVIEAGVTGTLGPTIAPVYTDNGQPGSFSVTVNVHASGLRAAADRLLALEAVSVGARPISLLFRRGASRYDELVAELGLEAAP